MAKTRTRRVRYCSGDVFQMSLPKGSFAYGRVLLDIFRLRRTGMFPTLCALSSESGLLVQLYRRAFSQPIDSVDQLIDVPTFFDEFLFHDQIYRAEFPIVGNLPVSPSEIDFPEYVCCHGFRHFTFQKGAIIAKIRISFEYSESLAKPTSSFGLVTEDVLKDIRNPLRHKQRAKGGDLRVDRRRNSILRKVGLRPSMSYDEMCARLGGQTAEELLAIKV